MNSLRQFSSRTQRRRIALAVNNFMRELKTDDNSATSQQKLSNNKANGSVFRPVENDNFKSKEDVKITHINKGDEEFLEGNELEANTEDSNWTPKMDKSFEEAAIYSGNCNDILMKSQLCDFDDTDDDDDDEVRQSVLESKAISQKDLSAWALKHQITDAALSDLLLILRKIDRSLPKDPRALFQKRRNVSLSSIGGGSNSVQITMAVQKLVKPMSDWTVNSVRKLANTETYEEARKIRKTAEITSDLQTNGSQPRRRRTREWFDEDSESSGSERRVANRLPLKKKKLYKRGRLISDTQRSDNPQSDHGCEQSFQPKRSTSTSKVIEFGSASTAKMSLSTPQNALDTLETHRNSNGNDTLAHRTTNTASEASLAAVADGCACSKFHAEILRMLDEIMANFTVLTNSINTLTRKLNAVLVLKSQRTLPSA